MGRGGEVFPGPKAVRGRDTRNRIPGLARCPPPQLTQASRYRLEDGVRDLCRVWRASRACLGPNSVPVYHCDPLAQGGAGRCLQPPGGARLVEAGARGSDARVDTQQGSGAAGPRGGRALNLRGSVASGAGTDGRRRHLPRRRARGPVQRSRSVAPRHTATNTRLPMLRPASSGRHSSFGQAEVPGPGPAPSRTPPRPRPLPAPGPAHPQALPLPRCGYPDALPSLVGRWEGLGHSRGWTLVPQAPTVTNQLSGVLLRREMRNR
jgi:hypothetical protein